MADLTLAPNPWFTGFSDLGIIVPGGLLFTYAAGTANKLATYTDVSGLVANTNPIVLDSAGRVPSGLFLLPASYKFVLAPATDTDPPTNPIRTQDNISATASFSEGRAVAGTAGENLALNDAVYESQGDGGRTAGRWYKMDADFAYASSLAVKIGWASAPLLSGITGQIQLVGRVTTQGLVVPGTVYYASATAGEITAVAPINRRIVGVADSAGTLLLGVEQPWTATAQPLTIATSPASGPGGALIRRTDGTRGLFLDSGTQWVSVNGGAANVMDFGAVGDLVADDTAAIQAAITAAGVDGTVIFPPRNYRTTATLNLFFESQTWLMYGAEIYADFAGVCLLVGDATQAGVLGVVKRWRLEGGGFRRFSGIDWTSGTVGIKLQKANNCTLQAFTVSGFERGVFVTTPSAAQDRWETTQNWFFPQQITECKYAWDFYADDDCCVNENQVTGGDHYTSAAAPVMTGASMIRIDRHAAALGNVNGIKFWGSYFSNGHAGANRPTLLALDGVGCFFEALHAENFGSLRILLTGDALLGGLPNKFSFSADSSNAEIDLASGGAAIAAAFLYEGTYGCQVSGGLDALSTYVQAVKQLGAVTKPAFVVKDLNDLVNFGVDGKGGIQSRASSLPNHKYITPKAAGTGTDGYVWIQSSAIEGLSDDTTVTILTGFPNESGILHVTVKSEGSALFAGASITFSTNATTPNGFIMAQAGSYTFAVTTADVTGTTGVDGQFTVSIRNGIIEFENRIGVSCRVKYWFMHG